MIIPPPSLQPPRRARRQDDPSQVRNDARGRRWAMVRELSYRFHARTFVQLNYEPSYSRSAGPPRPAGRQRIRRHLAVDGPAGRRIRGLLIKDGALDQQATCSFVSPADLILEVLEVVDERETLSIYWGQTDDHLAAVHHVR